MVWTQENKNEDDGRGTIQRIAESLYQGGFDKYDKG